MFFKLGSIEKSSVLNEIRARKIKLAEKQRKFKEDKILLAEHKIKTKVEWPILPASDDAFGVQTSENAHCRRKSRKESSFLYAPKNTPDPKTKSIPSITEKFTKASKNTLDFIREIENQESFIKKRTSL